MSGLAKIGDIFTEWMSRVDACPKCPNTEPPWAAIPSSRPGRFIASYGCSYCQESWTREYETRH